MMLDNKGVSPILAILLMILVTVLLSLATWYWIHSYTQAMKESINRATCNYNTRITLLCYSYSEKNNKLTLTLYLTSNVEVKVTHVVVISYDGKVLLSKSVSWIINSKVNTFTITFDKYGNFYEINLKDSNNNVYTLFITIV